MDETADVVLDVHDGYIDVAQIFERAIERMDLTKDSLPDTDPGAQEEAKDG